MFALGLENIIEIANFLASDVLLSIFFFVIGLELIEEFRNGELKDVKHASLPALAAVGGVIVPALIYILVLKVTNQTGEVFQGWAIPTATDVAFSLAVLNFFAKRLKGGTKLFLLVLAVVDDVIGIVIIAVVFSKNIDPILILLTLLPITLWVIFSRRKKLNYFVLATLAVLVWLGIFCCGIHPTIAGVILGVTVPANRFDIAEDDPEFAGKKRSRALYWSERISPFSSKIVVPVFAVISILASVYQLYLGIFESSTSNAPHESVAFIPSLILILAVTLALVFGKPIGITVFAWIGQHLTPLKLFHGLKVRDLFGVTCLGGIGFTVSFLIAQLSFANPTMVAVARVGVVTGSLLSALIGAAVLAVSVAMNSSACLDEKRK